MSTTRHIETDALGALHEELMRAARRRASRRRPPRRALVIAAVAGALLAATAATAALTDFSTGVPVVDELVGIERGPVGPLLPGPGGASEALSVPMGDGVYKIVAYLARDRGVCIVSAQRHRGGVRGGYGGCPALDVVNRRVERSASWHASSHGADKRTYQLLVAGEVEAVRPLGEGDWEIHMTPPWTPEAPGARPLRLVVAIDDEDIDVGGDGLQPEELGLLDMRVPRLELVYADGTTRTVTPFRRSRRRGRAPRTAPAAARPRTSSIRRPG